MENSLIFVIIIMFYFCVVFPFQMRHYLLKRQRRLASLQESEPSLVNNSSYTRNVTYLNSANNFNRANRSTESSNVASEDTRDYERIFQTVHMPSRGTRDSPRSDDEIAAARHQEAEHRQQIIDIQRVIEEQAARRQQERQPQQEAEHRQQIIDIQRGIEEQAIRRQQERLPYPNAPHMPVRLINSSTIRSSVFTINTSSHTTGLSNSSINYPHAPPLIPDGEIKHLRMSDCLNAKDDGLPSYDQAVAFDSTTTAVTISRY